MKVADQVADWLYRNGVKHAFSVIGGGNVALWDAIARYKETELVCCHHEQAAVMAACGAFRVGGKICVALVTTGAGSTNAITGVMAAYMDSTPVVVLSGNESSEFLEGHTRILGTQGYCSSNFASPITKYAAQYNHKVPIVGMLEAAKHEALMPRMGPVWLDIPKDFANAEI